MLKAIHQKLEINQAITVVFTKLPTGELHLTIKPNELGNGGTVIQGTPEDLQEHAGEIFGHFQEKRKSIKQQLEDDKAETRKRADEAKAESARKASESKNKTAKPGSSIVPPKPVSQPSEGSIFDRIGQIDEIEETQPKLGDQNAADEENNVERLALLESELAALRLELEQKANLLEVSAFIDDQLNPSVEMFPIAQRYLAKQAEIDELK